MEEAGSDGPQRVEGHDGSISGQVSGIGATSPGEAANQSGEEHPVLQKLAHELQEVTSEGGQTDVPPRHESLTPPGDMPLANDTKMEDGEDQTKTTTVIEQRNALDTILAAGGPITQAQDDGNQTVSGLPAYKDYGTSPFTQDHAPSLPILPNGTPMTDGLFSEAALSIVESEAPRIQAFAKLEFDDGQFYMNTYSVELGRDIRAARLASQWDLGSPQEPDVKMKKRSTSSGDASQTPIRIKREDSRKMAGSVVSESGGIMGVDVQNSEPRRRTKGKKSKSTDSSSQYRSRKSSGFFPAVQTDYQSLAMASLTDSTFGSHPVDPLSLLPSPDECPLIPIHPPVVPEGVPAGHRGISRKHVKIAFNFEKHLFEIEIKGKNGAFVDEQWHAQGERQPLRSGSYIQIGGVGVRFVLPDVALGETGAEGTIESNPTAGGKMSFDFEDGRGESIAMADSSEVDSGDKDEATPDDSDEEEDEDEEDERGEEGQEGEGMAIENADQVERAASEEGRSEQSAQEVIEPPIKEEPKVEPVLPPPKRKGPGRPPKNGIISKREQALLARQAREAAKKEAEAKSSGKSLPGKGKSVKAKTGKEASPEVSSAQPKPEKRKYTKRKSKVETSQDGQQDIRETTEPGQSIPPDQNSEGVAAPKPLKEKKPPKPPRSPSPVFDEATMTPEQLAKPQSSYVVLIHEALSNSKIGAMSLPQIYRAIERRYPFYKLRVQTTGWQSSVRHNLSQHPAFRKVERDGKGWMWGLVPEVSIEKEKKRRPSPPPMPPQGYYPQNAQMPRYPYPYPGQPLPHGHVPPHYGMYPGMPAGVIHGPEASNPPGYAAIPPGAPIALPPPLANAQANTTSSYQSPYQPTPQAQPVPPQPPPPPSSSLNGANGIYANPNIQPPPPPSPMSNPPAPGPSPSPAPNPPQTQPQHPPLRSPTPAPHPHPTPSSNLGHDVLTAVGKFKTALISSMPDPERGEQIVTSAINRTLGLQSASSMPGGEDPQEKAIMQALAGMLGNLSKKSMEAQQRQASNPPPSATNPHPPLPQQQQQPQPQPQQQAPPQAPPQQPPPQQPRPPPPPSPLPAQGIQQPRPPPPPPPLTTHSPQHQRPPPTPAQQGAQAQLLQLLQHIGRRAGGPLAPPRQPMQQQQQQQYSPGLMPSASPVGSPAAGAGDVAGVVDGGEGREEGEGEGEGEGVGVGVRVKVERAMTGGVHLPSATDASTVAITTNVTDTSSAKNGGESAVKESSAWSGTKRTLDESEAALDVGQPEAKRVAVE